MTQSVFAMSEEDTTKRRLALSIVAFLRQEKTSPDLTLENRDNLQIAMESLQNAYDLRECHEIQRRPLLDMFMQVYNPVSVADRLRSEALKVAGNTKMAYEQYKEAEHDYSQAIELDRFNSIFYCNRAGARIKLQKYFEATSDCRMALNLNPDYAKAYDRMGQAYAFLNRHRSAARCFRQALELEPDNETHRNNIRAAEQRVAEDAASLIGNLISGIRSSGVTGSFRREYGRMNGSRRARVVEPDNGTNRNNLRSTEQRVAEEIASRVGTVLIRILPSVLAGGESEFGLELEVSSFMTITERVVQVSDDINTGGSSGSRFRRFGRRFRQLFRRSGGSGDSENESMLSRTLLGIARSQEAAGQVPIRSFNNIEQMTNIVEASQKVQKYENKVPENQSSTPHKSEKLKPETKTIISKSSNDIETLPENSNTGTVNDLITLSETPENQRKSLQQSETQKGRKPNSNRYSDNSENVQAGTTGRNKQIRDNIISWSMRNKQDKRQNVSQNHDSKSTSLKQGISKFFKNFGKSTSNTEDDKNKKKRKDLEEKDLQTGTKKTDQKTKESKLLPKKKEDK